MSCPFFENDSYSILKDYIFPTLVALTGVLFGSFFTYRIQNKLSGKERIKGSIFDFIKEISLIYNKIDTVSQQNFDNEFSEFDIKFEIVKTYISDNLQAKIAEFRKRVNIYCSIKQKESENMNKIQPWNPIIDQNIADANEKEYEEKRSAEKKEIGILYKKIKSQLINSFT